MRLTRVLLVIVAVVCFGVALSYPIRYYLAQKSNDGDMEQLSQMRSLARTETPGQESDSGEDEAEVASPAEGNDGGAQSAVEPVGTGRAAPAPTVAAGDGEIAVARREDGMPTRIVPGKPGGASSESPGTFATMRKDQPAGAASASDGSPTTDETGLASASDGSPTTDDTGAVDASDGSPITDETGMADASDGSLAADEAGMADGFEGEPATGAAGNIDAVPEITPTPTPAPTPEPTLDPLYWDLSRYDNFMATPTPQPTATPMVIEAGPAKKAGPTRDPNIRTGALPYDMKQKVALDESAILPELKDIYALNHDLVGWLTIPDTVIDYPVVQVQDKDNDYYLTHDFYGEENINGQIILDAPCDPYTPGYNLVISGHHMKNGSMFGNLPLYATKRYWEQHPFLEFDTLMARKQYVVFAAFYSADYDEDEEGFRYNADIRYKIDAKQWLDEVHANQLYDTEIDAEFGDEFITLTTCNRARHRNGRFVVVARRIREGETFE